MLVETRRCGRLYVDVRGEGSPIVLWPSVLCSGSMWSSIPEELSRAHRVINIDGPGHGRSSRVREPYTLDDNVDAALAVLDACGVRRAVWCGLSWGAMVGMRLALRAPERVSGLVLIDGNADREVPEKLPAYRAMAMISRLLGPIPPLLDRLEPIYFSPYSLRANRPAVDAFRRGVAAMDRESIRRAVDAVILGREDLRPQLPRIDAPTLVVVGADDVATPRARSEDIVAGIRGARLVQIPRAGHLSAWEQPDAVREAIEGFLATLAPQSARRMA
ncbi:alpha/beta fold hydrolase [Sandaracinus amylolyticus]|uniref:alpha/beta fold hydrolase n=1 Tax=Sandaracinus amylolyticus TaxID=927083 RepID=UPI001F42FCD1|nr:alpha/beta fold hydrolase [Sandaracinus amylolyticus]UJR80665.1 Beta-ketoadipate enol-lactone hydrolase [Sandaracinus amylolyticus]